ncbi:MAG TPA: glycosyltransferase, partial [Acidimicrobiales bacterium]|nr:glycosyltransferase [Acidimicrobiales bacterium]
MRRFGRRRRQRVAAQVTPEAVDQPDTQQLRVLIISASMGAGHDGAARELASRLRADGHEAEVRDFLDAMPLRLGRLLRVSYAFELKHLPSAYDATYRIWYRLPWLCPLITWLVCYYTRRRVLRWVRRYDAQVTVSTYPLATVCLGRLRTMGRLRIPALNFITDFGVHPLWVHRGIDLNLAVHRGPADMARRHSGRPSFACGPLVSDLYDPDSAAAPEARMAARDALRLDPDDRGVLIVAGSWGVGRVDETFRTVARTGRYVPVVVCGRDETLRARLQHLAEAERLRAVVVGWTDRMPELMAGCDALIENAGGLTSLEAMRIGLPVVSYDPIAGHGRENTSAMASAGISRLAGNSRQLIDVLDLVTSNGPARTRQVDAGQAMFVSDGAKLVASAGRPEAVAALGRPSRARVAWVSASRTAVGLLALAGIGWGGITTGVNMTAHAGAGVAHPSPGIADAYVGVRLSAAELRDPAVRHDVEGLGATVVVDMTIAARSVRPLRQLAAAGVDIEDGGHGGWVNSKGQPVSPAPWTRASGDAVSGVILSDLIRRPVDLEVPGRKVNGFDMLDSTTD